MSAIANIHIAEEQIKLIIKETIRQTFLELGINVGEPVGMVEYQKDQHYLRTERLRREATTNKAWLTFVGMVMSAIGAAIILGAASFFRQSN